MDCYWPSWGGGVVVASPVWQHINPTLRLHRLWAAVEISAQTFSFLAAISFGFLGGTIKRTISTILLNMFLLLYILIIHMCTYKHIYILQFYDSQCLLDLPFLLHCIFDPPSGIILPLLKHIL